MPNSTAEITSALVSCHSVACTICFFMDVCKMGRMADKSKMRSQLLRNRAS